MTRIIHTWEISICLSPCCSLVLHSHMMPDTKLLRDHWDETSVSATKTKPPVFFLKECSEPVSLGYLAWRHFTPEAIMTSAIVFVSGILFAHCAIIIRTGLWHEWQKMSVQKSSSSDRKSKLTVKKQDIMQKWCLISKTTAWHQCLHFRSWNEGAYDWCSPL